MIKSLIWDFIGRVRNKTFCLNDADNDWYTIKHLYQQASVYAKHFDSYQMSRHNPIDYKMVVIKK